MTKASGPTVIKKYANRRLYHTGTSTYVTLEDLAVMVKKGEDFAVSDAKTGEEISAYSIPTGAHLSVIVGAFYDLFRLRQKILSGK